MHHALEAAACIVTLYVPRFPPNLCAEMRRTIKTQFKYSICSKHIESYQNEELWNNVSMKRVRICQDLGDFGSMQFWIRSMSHLPYLLPVCSFCFIMFPSIAQFFARCWRWRTSHLSCCFGIGTSTRSNAAVPVGVWGRLQFYQRKRQMIKCLLRCEHDLDVWEMQRNIQTNQRKYATEGMKPNPSC